MRAAPVLTDTFKPTVAFPVPAAPDVTEIQVTLLVAVHGHVLTVDTLTEPAPPVDSMFCVVGATVYEQAACVTVNAWVAIVSVPTRCAPTFDAIVNATDPAPLPLAPDAIVIHAALLAAVHGHPLGAVTET